ncbi:hypothetical protein LT335_00113 [Spiroplasma sp. JKS002669]|uniref:hypothetical protein n=1 Tax=Spiroplasma attinicola TaxID=2904537 RepID=UPI002022C529|nr:MULTISPECIES: hypothetical protein [unclassified Spiroplasma]MCL6428574.1 hypothetical protein [Spiroplasma sp. JKS002669]MCL8209915.1 hypothetical protein [Spiroplasma sp. JKS002670]MCL8210869.1 hypothetical protein [Spiroplasma sp. JKS002671]
MPVWQIILLAIALLFAVFSVFMWIWNVTRAKKLRNETFVDQQKDSEKVKIPFKVDKFIDALGGINNISNTSVKNTKLKIEILSHDKVDFSQLKKIKNNGILVQSDNITIVLGDYASNVSVMINDLINLNNNPVSTEIK